MHRITRLTLICLLVLTSAIVLPPPPAHAQGDPPTYTQYNGTVSWTGDNGLDSWQITHPDLIQCEFSPNTALSTTEGHPAPAALDIGSLVGDPPGVTVQFRCFVTDRDNDFTFAGNMTWHSWLQSGVATKYPHVLGYNDYCAFTPDDGYNWSNRWGGDSCTDSILASSRGFVTYGNPPLWQNVTFNTSAYQHWVKDYRLIHAAAPADHQLMDSISFSYIVRVLDEEEPPDEPNPCESQLFNFTTGTEGWLPPPNNDLIVNTGGQSETVTHTNDTGTGELYAAGFQPGDPVPDEGSTEYLNTWYVYEEPCEVTRLSLRWQISPVDWEYSLPDLTLLPPLYLSLYQAENQVLTLAAEYQLVQDAGSHDTWLEYTWYPADARNGFSEIDAINIYRGDKALTLPDGNSPNMGPIWIDWIDIRVGTTSADLTRPLLAGDELDFGLFDTPFRNDYDTAITAFSVRWGDPVHAINAGTVSSVRPTLLNDPNLCNDFLGVHRARWSAAIGNLISSVISLPGWARPDNTCLLSHPQLPVGSQFNWLGVVGIAENLIRQIAGQPTHPRDIFVDLRDTYTVVVASAIGDVHYFLQRPTVQPGDTVSAGCRLGYTAGYYAENMDAITNPGSIVDVAIDTLTALPLSSGGLTIVAIYDTDPVLLPPGAFLQDPSGSPCPSGSSGAVDSQCINNNPTFAGNAEGWLRTSDTSIVLPDGGLRITGMVYHEAVLALDPASEYSLIVEAHLEQPAPDGQDSVLLIGLGDATPPHAPLEMTVPASGDTTRFSVPPQVWPENYGGGQYELYLNPGLFNSGTIVVTFLCISDDEADPVNLPSACYFADPEFNSGAGWTPSSGALNGDPVFEHGAATIPYSAHVSQTITLQPGDYAIEYTGRLHPQLFTGEPYIELGWSFDTLSGGKQLPNTYWEQGSDAFTVQATTTATFTFAAVNGVSADETAIQLDRVCIMPDTGPPATGGGTGDSCAACHYTPNGDVAHDIVEMITWLACIITNLWHCEIYPIAQGTWDGVLEMVRGVGMLGRYLAYSFKVAQEYLLSLTYFLAGHIQNVGLRVTEAAGSSVVYIAQGGSMTLWDVLGALITGLRDVIVTALDDILAAIYLLLNFLTPVVTTLATVILSIVNILVTVLNALLTQVLIVPMMAERLIVSFVTAAATPVPGMPNCSVLDSNPICMGIYIIDNTLLSGPAKMLLPVLLAAATVWVVLWTMDRFSEAFR